MKLRLDFPSGSSSWSKEYEVEAGAIPRVDEYVIQVIDEVETTFKVKHVDWVFDGDSAPYVSVVLRTLG